MRSTAIALCAGLVGFTAFTAVLLAVTEPSDRWRPSGEPLEASGTLHRVVLLDIHGNTVVPSTTPTPTQGLPRFSSLLTWRHKMITATPTPTATATPTATPEPTWTPEPPPPPPPTEAPVAPAPAAAAGGWEEIVCSYGWSCAEALNVIAHESGGDPWAVNSSSGACGLFQMLPCVGYGDVHANVAAAWLKYIDGGYSFWRHWYQWW